MSSDTCAQCPDAPKLITFRFQPGQMPPPFPLSFTACIFCSPELRPYVTVKGADGDGAGGGAGAAPRALLPAAPKPAPKPAAWRNAGSPQPPPGGAMESAMSLNVMEPGRRHGAGPAGGGRGGGGRGGGGRGGGGRGPATAGRGASGSAELPAVSCGCGEAAAVRTVQKETANKGRQFYTCAKPQGQGCGFFQWTDEVAGGGGGGGGGGPGPGPGGGGVAFGPGGGRGGGRAERGGRGSPRDNDGGRFPTNFVPASGLLNRTNSAASGDGGGAAECLCGQAAARFQSKKENANKGKWFFTCADRKCTYFQWEE